MGDDPTTAEPVPLRDWQTLDWRFLVPAAPRRVGYLGPVSPVELRAVQRAGLELVPLSSGDDTVDLVIVASDDPRTVDRALAVLEPGGWLMLRVHSTAAVAPTGPARGRARRRNLAIRGLVGVRTYWHAPDLRRCAYVVDLGDRVAVGAMLRRYQGVRLGRAQSVVARALARLGLLELVARDVTVVAQRPAADPGPEASPALAGLLPSGAPGCSTLLMTPWFDASRHVLALYVRPAGHRIAAVAKLPRRPWDVGGIVAEASALRTVEAAGPPLADAAPRVLTLDTGGPRPFLLQTGVSGTAIGPQVVRGSAGLVLAAGTALVDALAAAPGPRAGAASFERLVTVPLERLARALDVDETRSLVSASSRLLAPLRAARLPAVLEHGDLGHPNLILTGRRVSAVDWERFEPEGLPGLDLVFFLQYVRECVDTAVTIEAQLGAFDVAFTGRGAWAGPFLRRYAARVGVPEVLLPHLVLAAWCRIVAGLVARLEPLAVDGDRAQDVTAHHVAATVTADRDYALWRRAVGRFDDLLA